MMKTAAERALKDALRWWEGFEIMVRQAGARGIALDEGYEPTWVARARAAVAEIASSEVAS